MQVIHPNKKTAGFRRNDHVRPCHQRKGPKPRAVYEGRMANGAVMSDEFHFNGEDDAKAEIRAAVRRATIALKITPDPSERWRPPPGPSPKGP